STGASPESGTADVRGGRFHWPESHTTREVYSNMQPSRANSGPARAAAARGAPPKTQPVQHLDVDEDEAGQRLDAYLARRFAGLPKSHLYRWIRSGQLRVNGARRSIDYRLQPGDRIRIPPIFGEPAAGARASPAGGEAAPDAHDPVQRERAQLARRLPVLFEDDDLLAIDKPASVAV